MCEGGDLRLAIAFADFGWTVGILCHDGEQVSEGLSMSHSNSNHTKRSQGR